MDLEEVREIVLRLTLYFEDVVSDLGTWRSFTSWAGNITVDTFHFMK